MKTIFRPRKLWWSLVVFALTVGIGVGEAQFRGVSLNTAVLRASSLQAEEPAQNKVLVARKLSHSLQAFAFGGRRGFSPFRHNVSVIDFNSANPLTRHAEPQKAGVRRVCFWEDESLEALYSGELTEVKTSDNIQPGERFRVEVYVENTSNRTWYSHASDCDGRIVVNMGTNKPADRASFLFYEGKETGWIGDNRVSLVEDAVRPGETATFAFVSVAPARNTIYREQFNLVAEGVSWFEDMEIPVDVRVGEVTEEDESKLKFMKDVNGNTADLTGERSIWVDLSEQRMSLRFGDRVVYSTAISSGASDTPTPVGTFKIMYKQELRVGGASPHYRMPYFQMFTKWGHGLHALPYLGTKGGGVFWEEALSHIGIPVSHGCIRLLPEDALLVYQFSDVGLTLEIQR